MNPTVKHNLVPTLLKALLTISITIPTLFIVSYKLGQVEAPPSFIGKGFKKIDRFDQTELIKTIRDYEEGKVSSYIFMSKVESFEQSFRSRFNPDTDVDSDFMLDILEQFELRYLETEDFPDNRKSAGLFLKRTLLSLITYIIPLIELDELNRTVIAFYTKLDTVFKDYDFDYQLQVYEKLVIGLEFVDGSRKEYLALVRTIEKLKSEKKSANIGLGLRSINDYMEQVLFRTNRKLMEFEKIRATVQSGLASFISNDSSFGLSNSLKSIILRESILREDYPFLLGSGYVEVLPADTYSVRQYGNIKDKTYIFEERVFKYRATNGLYVLGTYGLENSTICMEVGRYKQTEILFKVSNGVYLLGSEILIEE